MDPYEAYLQMLQQPAVPSATEQANWASQRRELGTNFANQTAQYNFGQQSLQTALGSDQNTLGQQYTRQRENLPTQYAARGLGNSGIYGRGLQEFNQDRTDAFGKLFTNYNLQQGQLATTQRGAYASLVSGVADVDESEAARRSDLATQIRSL